MMFANSFRRVCSPSYLTAVKEVSCQSARCFSVAPSPCDDLRVDYLTGPQQGIVTMGFNRPQAKNAISKNLVNKLFDALTALKRNDNARVLILHSTVKNVFCAGADLKERAVMPESEVGPFVSRIRQGVADIDNLPIPTIAALDGVALGGGLEIALSCDLRTASSTAKMGLVETRLAIIPGGGGTQKLARLVGPAIAKELIFTARIIDGQQAHKIGLVNHVVEQNEDGNSAFLKALEIAEEIAKQGPIAIRAAKIAISKGLEVDLQTGLAIENLCYERVIKTEDRMEGLRAFKEKRLPNFRGV